MAATTNHLIQKATIHSLSMTANSIITSAAMQGQQLWQSNACGDSTLAIASSAW